MARQLRAVWERLRPSPAEARLVSLPSGAPISVHARSVGGIELELEDFAGSTAVASILDELGHGAYDLSDVALGPGDVVIDVGAHVGAVSIWIAKAHPEVRVLAFEPLPPTYQLLQRNLVRNGVTNVAARSVAVTGDGRDLRMVAHLGSNSGGGTAQLRRLDMADHDHFVVPSVSLDDVITGAGTERVKLLKIDCEGSEHEILYASRCLGRVEHLRGEFHENSFLRAKGYSMAALASHCEAVLGPGRVRYTPCQMADW